MIATVIRMHWWRLKRDYTALALTFILPVLFFSIYAAIFADIGSGAENGDPVSVIVRDLDDSAASRQLAIGLTHSPDLAVSMSGNGDTQAVNEQVRSGDVAVAVTIPRGFAESWKQLQPQGSRIDLVYDAANPYARYIVMGQLQTVALVMLPQVIATHADAMLGNQSGRSVNESRFIADLSGLFCPTRADAQGGGDTPNCETVAAQGGILAMQASDVRGQDTGMIAYYAAGVGVMFLLFSMAGAGGSILEEQEGGTLERLLNSQLRMGHYLLGSWLFFATVGVMQLGVMFAWGALVFDLPFHDSGHILAVALMTVVTAVAAAAFGMVMATMCRSRAQLAGISTVVILVMSALGGSMVPRFVMPAFMKTVGLFTFNGWALDGFMKIFWNDITSGGLVQTLIELGPNIGILLSMATGFLLLAYRLARRWEVI